MPPRGVKSQKRTRQYEHVKDSEVARGVSPRRAKEIAARTVNKQRSKAGEAKIAPRRATAGKTSRKTGTASRKTGTASRKTGTASRKTSTGGASRGRSASSRGSSSRGKR